VLSKWPFVELNQEIIKYFKIKTQQNHFHIRAVHRDIIKVFYSSTNAQVIVLKTIIKFTLK
jgi:hypothetical protein